MQNTQSPATFDHLFTSLPLPDKLSEDSTYGTIQENLLQGGLLMKKSDLQKRERGAYNKASDGKNIVIAWHDNKVVIIVINYLSCEPISSIKHWFKSERKHIDVTMPKSFKIYNESMGGVNLFDQFNANYQV